MLAFFIIVYVNESKYMAHGGKEKVSGTIKKQKYTIGKELANCYLSYKKMAYFNDNTRYIDKMVKIGYVKEGSVVNENVYLFIEDCCKKYNEDKNGGLKNV